MEGYTKAKIYSFTVCYVMGHCISESSLAALVWQKILQSAESQTEKEGTGCHIIRKVSDECVELNLSLNLSRIGELNLSFIIIWAIDRAEHLSDPWAECQIMRMMLCLPLLLLILL
jgi:hypothetical protein